ISKHATNPLISANGRFVAFDYQASDLGSDANVYLSDLQTGTTTLASVNYAGTGPGNEASELTQSLGSPRVAISAEGRFLAFTSLASDLVANDGNGTTDVFVRDFQTGVTTLVSIDRAGTDSGDGDSENPVISADGRYVAFESSATNLTDARTLGNH